MPIMNGVDALHQIIKIDKEKKIPVIAITAFAFEHEKKKLMDEGFDNLIIKPINQQLLLSLIGKYLR